jgi:serine/threonine-protein kinase RsbW
MEMQWRFPAVPDSVSAARAAAREAAGRYGADDVLLDSIALCVSEAVTNAVIHAYHGRSPGDVELEAHKPDGYVCIYVRDSGGGMRPRPDSPGAGFGLPLMSQLASEVAVRARAREGTELVLRFDLTG